MNRDARHCNNLSIWRSLFPGAVPIQAYRPGTRYFSQLRQSEKGHTRMRMISPSRLLMLIIFLVTPFSVAAAADSIRFDTKTGLFVIKRGGAPLVNGNFVFWKGKWEWATPELATNIIAPGQYSVTSNNKPGEFSIDAQSVVERPGRLGWSMTFEPGETTELFGGLSFVINQDLNKASGGTVSAAILDDGSGWTISLSPGEPAVKISFEPKPETVFFERGQSSEIRVYFAGEGNSLASGTYTMTVDLPEQLTVSSTSAERLAPVSSDWYENLLPADQFPVDLSYLNAPEKPAGKRGFLAEADGQLAFADGTRARFWGTNLTAYALFQTGLDDTVQQARRLSKLGFNLVRIHHLDSVWVEPNIFASDGAEGVKLNAEAMRALDWWIKALSDEGIYVWFDLNVGRVFAPEGVEAAEELNDGNKGGYAQGFAYLNETIEARMKALNRLILSHVNQYTGLAYKDDPRIAFYLITNENDLSHHFGNLFLPNQKRPVHGARYMAASAEFAAQHDLDPDKTWRSWEFGPSKLFLNDLEHRFNQRMIAHLRAEGAKVPIVTTSSFGFMTVAGLPSLTDGGAVAVHAYDDNYILETDPTITPNLTSWLAAAGIAGKPLVVPEWNTSDYPSRERAALPIYLSAIASLQDWDAVMVYAYSQRPLGKAGNPTVWEVGFDPSALAAMASAALIYRGKHVERDPQIRYIAPTPEQFIDQPLSPLTSKAIRTLTETGRFRLLLPALPALEWFKPASAEPGATRITDMQQDFSGGGNSICAETGEFCRDWENGIFKLDTDRSKAAAGWIGGRQIELSGTEIAVSTAYASVSIQSLDAAPIVQSHKILVSLAAQTMPGEPNSNAAFTEPVAGRIAITASPGLHAFQLSGNGLARPMQTRYENGKYILNLDHRLNSLWIMLTPP